jgi:hypothetical protein
VFIFDTDIYTNVMRKVPSETLLNRLKKVPRRDQFTTTITMVRPSYLIAHSSTYGDALNFNSVSSSSSETW